MRVVLSSRIKLIECVMLVETENDSYMLEKAGGKK